MVVGYAVCLVLLYRQSVPDQEVPGGILPGIGPQRPLDWGLGFEIRSAKDPHWTGTRNSPATAGHFGASGTFLWFDPVAGLACVCLTDHDFDDGTLPRWRSLSDAVLDAWTSDSS